MRYFRLSLMALLSIILVVSPMVGCTPASGDEDWENKYETLKIENTFLKVDFETAKADVAYLKSALEELRDDYDTQKAEYDTLKSDHSTLKATSEKLQDDYNLIQTSYDVLQTEYNTTQANYNTLKTDYDSLKGDLILYDTALAAQIADYNSLKANYDTLVALYNELVQLVSSTPPVPAPTSTYATWIDEYEATYGELPVVPDWMLDLMPELNSGDRIRKDVIFIKASVQYWSRRSPSQKEMILETVAWLGMNPVDYEWSIGR